MVMRVLIPIANGVEEIEAVTMIDVLRRAGAEVTVAAVGGRLAVSASRGVNLVADDLVENVVESVFDLIALPGGMPGAEVLAECGVLIDMLKQQRVAGRYYAAICAAPAVVLEPHGLLDGITATAHPQFCDRLGDSSQTEHRVVQDGNCITSRAPGTAMEFALRLVECLYGRQRAQAIAAPMLVAFH